MEKTALDTLLNFTRHAGKDHAAKKIPADLEDVVGAGGESSRGSKQLEFNEQSEEQLAEPSLNDNASGDNNGFESTPGLMATIGYIILRSVFCLAVTFAFIVSGLYVAKLTNLYDPCQKNALINSQCTAVSYAKGMMYYVKCTEERFCLLPGFWSKTSTAGWSFTKPDELLTTVSEKDAIIEEIDS